MRLLQSASFFTPTLGNELYLLTNNGATSSELLAHKSAFNSFWAPTGHQQSRSKHCQHSSSGHIPAPGKCCPQHYWAHSARNATTGQHLVFNRSAHYSGSPSLHHCQHVGSQHSDGLCCPRALSAHSASHGLTLP